MRAFFFWLLLANVVFFAWIQHAPPVGEREPTRLATQINEDKVKILTTDGVASPSPAPVPAATPAPTVAVAPPAPVPTPAPTPTPAAPPPKSTTEAKPKDVCHSYPGIAASLARSLQAEIVQGNPGLKVVLPQAKDADDFWVYIPPRANRAAAEKKLEELRQIGIDDAFLIQEAGPHQFAISLGLFRSEEQALQHLSRLGKQGVRSAQVMGRERNRGDGNEKLTVNISGNPNLIAQIEKDNKTLAGAKSVDCTP